MTYDKVNKKLCDVELSKTEWQIFEILLENKGEMLTLNQIANIMCNKYYYTGLTSYKANDNSVLHHIQNINKKLKRENVIDRNIVKRTIKSDYYIDDNIEIK